MSDYQKTHNNCISLLPVFQKKWGGELTALQAFEQAKAAKLNELAEKIKQIDSLAFEDMQNHGVVVREVTTGCKR